jgi:hypothetical protein
MAQTKAGAILIAAKRAGLTPSQYAARISKGDKWCTLCQKLQPREDFAVDRSRYDGLMPSCKSARSQFNKSRYVPKARERGRSFVPARDGDVKQARRRINYFVEKGLIPSPLSLPCVDCGRTWQPGGRRHEYDHHLGYDAEHHEHVEVVCSDCHHKREHRRRGGKRSLRAGT